MAVVDLARSISFERIDRRTLAGGALAALAAVLVLILTRPDPTFPVLVAGADLPAGVPLVDLSVDVRLVRSADGMVEGDTIGELAGWTLAHPLGEGEPLLPSLLRPPELRDAPDLFALALDPTHAVLGRVAAGDRVDVYVTWRGTGSPQTDLLASDVYVAEARTGSAPVGGRAQVELLLAVDDVTAAGLASAVRGGEIDLVRKSR